MVTTLQYVVAVEKKCCRENEEEARGASKGHSDHRGDGPMSFALEPVSHVNEGVGGG